MAATITDFDGLKAAIATWLARVGDTDVTTNAEDIILLGEARLRLLFPSAGLSGKSDATLTGGIGSRNVTLPDDFLRIRELYVTIDSVEKLLIKVGAGRMPVSSVSGLPLRYQYINERIELDRPCDQAYPLRLYYWAKTGLSDASPTNSLLTRYPNVYLYACLAEAAILFQDDSIATFEALLDKWARLANAVEGSADGGPVTPMDPATAGVANTGGRYNITTDEGG